MVFFAVLVFGAASVVIGRVRGSGAGDTALHLDGTWVTEGPTYNYESIRFEFFGDGFTSVSERILFSDSPDDLTLARGFYETYHDAQVDAEDTGYGSYLLRITTSGMFVLDGNSILLITGDSTTRRLPFYWDGDVIEIYPDRFVRGDA